MKANSTIQIEDRKIGLDYDPLVIAEIGINHNGSLSEAMNIVDAAARVGVEIVKHQTHVVADEMTKEAKNIIPSHTKKSIYEIMETCALSEEDEVKLQAYVKSKGLIFISTPFSRAAADRLQRMNVPAYKIGSGECNNYPLIEHIAHFRKPVILSTGMNTIPSIRIAVNILRENKVPFALLHTTNVYPTPPQSVRLGAMTELANEFPGVVVGLSDHTISNHACLCAVALGASILERHFTDHMEREGPDISCSMDPQACHDLIQDAKLITLMRGGAKKPVDDEKLTSEFAFASVVTIKDIQKGEVLTRDNLWVKRPGTGEILARDYDKILGNRASNNISIDEMLKWSDLESR
ncbi:MAG: N-acetylneuraminate synthase family protein [Saprospiraceae bacterium]|nr:N-acetylneuraminate synthase family protein [Saprospiraceae bacterium]